MICSCQSLIYVGFDLDRIANAERTFWDNQAMSHTTQSTAECTSGVMHRKYKRREMEKSRAKCRTALYTVETEARGSIFPGGPPHEEARLLCPEETSSMHTGTTLLSRAHAVRQNVLQSDKTSTRDYLVTIEATTFSKTGR